MLCLSGKNGHCRPARGWVVGRCRRLSLSKPSYARAETCQSEIPLDCGLNPRPMGSPHKFGSLTTGSLVARLEATRRMVSATPYYLLWIEALNS